jgi:hypothetical protein
MRYIALILAVVGFSIRPSLADCDYQASNVVTTSTGLTADLRLTGSCTQYPSDPLGALLDLKLLVEQQSGKPTPRTTRWEIFLYIADLGGISRQSTTRQDL